MSAMTNAITLTPARLPRREINCKAWQPASQAAPIELPISLRTVFAGLVAMGLGTGLVYLTLS